MATKRVLVIDDEADVRAVVQGCLEDIAGWNVVTAASGFEGLQRVLIEQPDAIVLDVMMPGMDGFAFLQALHSQAQDRCIPVILLTAKINLDYTPTPSVLSIKGIISKPFDPFILAEQVASILNWQMES
ncbi:MULTISPECIES: response regulator [unclassified Leptolyngbya]|uniref:response regulator n=1 Tax=unclassified Leptolyngbya TaxID=2650499 RepID=UPI0016876F36|nr:MULTISPECIES: response regulator [unclassified Leptolyngbya]MBD1909348.1 response regulator [Leptolyngbya sp. FACHB-8]MBD2158118.1 response regulator [Leptolyngbya sp. FACHB-16]